jgi:hypothetical protein
VLLSSTLLGRGSNKRLSASHHLPITVLLTVRPPDPFGLPAHSRARRVLPESQCTFLTKVHDPADEPSWGIELYFPTCSALYPRLGWGCLQLGRYSVRSMGFSVRGRLTRSNGTAARHETHAAFPVVVIIALDYTPVYYLYYSNKTSASPLHNV